MDFEVVGGEMLTIETQNSIMSIPEFGYYDNGKYKPLFQDEVDLIKRKLLESNKLKGNKGHNNTKR